MADPVSGEPQNWDNDILLKITMPGKELREVTKVKQQASVEHYEKMYARQQQQAVQQPTPIHVATSQPIFYQQPMQTPAPVVQLPLEQPAQQSLPQMQEPVIVPEVQQPTTEEQKANMPVQNDGNNQIDLLSKLANPNRTAEQEWKREVTQRVQEKPVQQAPLFQQPAVEQRPQQIPSDIIVAKKDPPQADGFYTNYPGLEMKPKYSVWTIEPTKDETPTSQPLNPQGERKAEDFASRIIGSDLVWNKVRKN